MSAAKIRGAKRTVMGQRDITIKDDYLAIIDFSSSTERRLYVMDLRTGALHKEYVAHGSGSGRLNAIKFSNYYAERAKDQTRMSSLGIYLGGDTYFGKHKESLSLYGIETSNSNAAIRDVVMHAANYVGESSIHTLGRLGLSWGCPAVSPNVIGEMIQNFKEGRVIYAYHNTLSQKFQQDPALQEVDDGATDDSALSPEDEQ